VGSRHLKEWLHGAQGDAVIGAKRRRTALSHMVHPGNTAEGATLLLPIRHLTSVSTVRRQKCPLPAVFVS
jgi:hypothetical protein